jgi:hypothetical protein
MQTLAYAPGGAIAFMRTDLPKLDLKTLETIANPAFRFDMTSRSISHEERQAMKDSARNTYQPAVAPAWLKHDRQVLRFYAYFQEPVHENPKENYRVRNCMVYFYLEDGTMMIVEPKVENSGIPQGTFVKRHRIPKPKEDGGDFFSPRDLKLGSTITIYSRSFRIVDCDDFTRHFYSSVVGDDDIGQPEEAPTDPFSTTQKLTAQDSTRVKAATNKDIIESREYSELALGGSRRNAKLQQYLENDRKVLLFRCFWDDPTRYGSRMYYTLHYYLSDDSVEMLENLPRNSGRDPYPVFWRRSPLRKNPHVSPAPGMLEPEAVHYKPEDFVVGMTVSVYGRDISLYDCDDFTREFYLRYTGFQQPTITVEEPQPIHVKLTYPPHTGFGEEDDSLASCLHLTPRAPRRDINKLMSDDGKVLRFQSQMLNGKVEDQNRRFVIAIFLADDSVGVWELRQRNSGHAEGKFARKSRMKNPATGTWFQPTDFQIGASIEINRTPFRILRADDATLKYMERNPVAFPCADAEYIAAKLSGLQDDFRSKGAEVTPDDIRQLARERLGVTLDAHEMVTLRRACGVKQEIDADDEFAEGQIEDAKEAPIVLITERLVQLINSA